MSRGTQQRQCGAQLRHRRARNHIGITKGHQMTEENDYRITNKQRRDWAMQALVKYADVTRAPAGSPEIDDQPLDKKGDFLSKSARYTPESGHSVAAQYRSLRANRVTSHCGRRELRREAY